MATIEIHMDDADLWSEIFGGGWESDPVSNEWIHGIAFDGGDWNIPCVATVGYYPEGQDDDDPKLEKKDLTVDDLAKALSVAIAKEMHHCDTMFSTDTTHWDSCVADVVLQLAVLGEYRFA